MGILDIIFGKKNKKRTKEEINKLEKLNSSKNFETINSNHTSEIKPINEITLNNKKNGEDDLNKLKKINSTELNGIKSPDFYEFNKKEIVYLLEDLDNRNIQVTKNASNKLLMYSNRNEPFSDNSNEIKAIIIESGISHIINSLKYTDNAVKKDLIRCLCNLNEAVLETPPIEVLDDDELSYDNIIKFIKLKEFCLEPLINNLSSENEKIAVTAALTLAQIYNDDSSVILGPLIECLNSDSIKLRRECVYILGSIGDKSAVEPIIKSLDHKDPYLRRRCVIALKKIGGQRIGCSYNQRFVTIKVL